MDIRRLSSALFICLAMSLPIAGAAFAQEAPVSVPAPAPLGSEWTAIDPARLERMRGGFELPSGLSLSFGIERVVYVNGQLVASTVVSIPDIARITPEQAQHLADFKRGMVVQIGDGNHFDSSGAGTGALVIQNTLNDQDIRAATQLSISVDTLGAFQDLNTFSALGDALNGAPGSP